MKRVKLLGLAISAFLAFGITSCESEDPIDDVGTGSGIVGTWEAYDISQGLVALEFRDTLIAKFNEDESYEVTAYTKQGIEIVFAGTYEETENEGNDIWSITLNQATMGGSPSIVTSTGIFEIKKTDGKDDLWYEVVQTQPEIAGVTPPTADEGFGSSMGGQYGTYFVQKYNRK